MLDRLRSQHHAIRQLVATFLVLLNRAQGCDPELLAEKRWELARIILQHLPIEERNVYRPLLEHYNEEVAGSARRSSAALNDLYTRFQAHSERWAADAATHAWNDYRASATGLMEELLGRIEHEERDLYPIVDTMNSVDTARRATDRNWAGDATRLRGLIGR